MSLSSSNKIGKKAHNKRQVMSDINITPFVDVLLVLLIIFMVSAPMMTSSIDVNLPQGVEKATNEKLQTITISIKEDRSIYLQDEIIKNAELPLKLKELSANNFTRKIFVRADKNLDYGKVMEIVKIINITGFTQVVLVTAIAEQSLND